LHAIQVVPFAAYLLAGRVSPQTALVLVCVLAAGYGGVCVLAFLQALAGIPILKA
jgi:hypothetical protein